jgi:hypothetical protein
VKRVILPISAVAALTLSAASFAASTDASTASLSAQMNQLSAKTKKLEREVASLKKTKGKHVTVKHAHIVVVHPWAHFVTVTTTPFLGRQTDYDGQDLLYNLSSNNEDLRLLMQKKALVDQMAAQGYELNRPILQLSGAVAGQGFSASGFNTGTNSGINLAGAELDMNAIASSWATAFMSMDFNGSPISAGNREPNSTIFLGRGFATIGNLNRFPVYFTAGLMYVPFGRYANGMVTTPLTMSLAKIRTPAALLGFSLDNGLRGSIYGYSGSQTSGGQPLFKQGGADVGYKHKINKEDALSVGGGWVSNIADSQGQQSTGSSTTAGQFGGFGVSTPSSTNNNTLVHAVEGVDAHATASLGPVSLIGEYLGAAERFNTADMTYNGAGAKPQATHAEVDYMLPLFAKKYDTTLGAGYGHTWQALALNLPENSYSVFLNTSIWRETGESIEFRHDTDYATSASALGRGATAAIAGTGRARNSITGQVGVYF